MNTLPRVLPPGTFDTIRECVSALRMGQVLAVPTDTVYGLVCLYDDEAAMGRIYEIKDRPRNQPLPVLLGTASELTMVARTVPECTWPLVYSFWPGPLTILLEAHPSLPSSLTGETGTVGVRVPKHPAVLELLEAAELPFASTSANRHGAKELLTESEVSAELGGEVSAIIMAQPAILSGVSSTVIDLTSDPITIRRQGSITLGQIRECLGVRVDLAANLRPH